MCKKDCKAAMSEATEFVDLIQEFEAKALHSTGDKEGELRQAFIELGRWVCSDLGVLCLTVHRSVILKCLGTLQSLGVDTKRKRDRLKLLLKRGDVQASVSECRDKMRVAKEKFNVCCTSCNDALYLS